MIQAVTTGRPRSKPINLEYGYEGKDNNVYSYRMIDGSKVFQRVKLGPGWENLRFTPNCEIKKGEESMAHKTGPHANWLDWGALMPQARKLLATGKSIPRTADILGIKVDTLRKRLQEEMKSPPDSDKVVKKCGYCGREIKEDEPDVWQIAGSIATYCDKCYKKIRLPLSSPEICAGCEYKGQIYKGQCYADCPEKTQTEPEGDQPDPATNEGQSAENIIQHPINQGDKKNEFYGTGPIELLSGATVTAKGTIERTYTAPLKGSYDECDKPQRKTITLTEYNDMAGAGCCECCGRTGELSTEYGANFCTECNDEIERESWEHTRSLTGLIMADVEKDRKAGWNQYCERTAAEMMIQGWAADVFKHHALSREKKLELIGRLLDWGQGA